MILWKKFEWTGGREDEIEDVSSYCMRHWSLKVGSLARTVWRTRFGSECGLFLRQTV